MFGAIYGGRNRLSASWSRLSLRMIEQFGPMAEAIRKREQPSTTDLADIGARLSAIANWFDWDLAEVVASKYHGSCPYCRRERSCGCPEASRGKLLRVEVDPHLLTLPIDAWQRLLFGLYGERNTEDGPLIVFLHMIEEFGELAVALRHRDIPNAREELADLVAWWMGYASAVGVAPLSQTIFSTYPGHCPRCGENPCRVNGPCPPF